MKRITNTILILSILLASSIALAKEPKPTLETDWLDTEIGSKGSVLGAVVVDVEKATDSVTIIEIKMPIDNPEAFDDIEVIDKKTLQPIKQKEKAKWIKYDEDGAAGLRLRVKKTDFEFRVRLTDND